MFFPLLPIQNVKASCPTHRFAARNDRAKDNYYASQGQLQGTIRAFSIHPLAARVDRDNVELSHGKHGVTEGSIALPLLYLSHGYKSAPWLSIPNTLATATRRGFLGGYQLLVASLPSPKTHESTDLHSINRLLLGIASANPGERRELPNE